MSRIEGHVFQPVMSWIQKELGEENVDEFWTFKSQLEPELELELIKMREQLKKFEERVIAGEERRRGFGGFDLRGSDGGNQPTSDVSIRTGKRCSSRCIDPAGHRSMSSVVA